MDQQRRRVLRRDVPHRAVPVQLGLLGRRVQPGDLLRPQAVLTQIMVEPAAGLEINPVLAAGDDNAGDLALDGAATCGAVLFVECVESFDDALHQA